MPAGADIYVLKNVLHDWPDDKAVEILRNVHAAAEIGTKILLIEFVIPLHSREYIGHLTDLEMLLSQAGRGLHGWRSIAPCSRAPGSG